MNKVSRRINSDARQKASFFKCLSKSIMLRYIISIYYSFKKHDQSLCFKPNFGNEKDGNHLPDIQSN